MALLDTLWLTTEQARQIASHAAARPTEEVCGLLFGLPRRQPPVAQVISIDNVAANPAMRYEMHPAQMVDAQMKAQQQGLELVSIYHSHPKSPPVPSETDVTESHYPDAVYLIVSLKNDEARFAAWSMADAEVKSVSLRISDHAPGDVVIETALSQAQKVAIVLSAVLAVAFLIVVSLVLLPPAPPLPN